MGGYASSLPEEQSVDLQLDNKTGDNMAEIVFDLRDQSEENTSFIQLHQQTVVGMTLVIVVVIIIALVLYAFNRCWCWKIHRWCGEEGTQINIMEMGRVNSGMGSDMCLDNNTETKDNEKPKRDKVFTIE